MPIRKDYVDTSRGQIHYRQVRGGEGDPILCFHMTSSSSKAYQDVLETLEGGDRPVYAFDTPNYGQSFRTTADPTIPAIAEMLIEAIDNLGIDRFYCLGHHTGSNISGQLAITYPDRVRGIMLAGVTYTSEEENRVYKDALSYDNPPDTRGSHIMTAWTRVVKDCEAPTPYDPSKPWNPVPAEVFHDELVDTLVAGEKWHWGYQAVFSHDMVGTVQKVRCPIMLIAGKQDTVYHWHERAKKALPHAMVVERDGYGVYYLSYGAHDAAPFIRQFISEIEQGKR